MNVTLFSATGKAGSRIQNELLARGHNVTAVVRDTTKVAPAKGLKIVAGDLSEPPAEIAELIPPGTVVVSAYGPPSNAPQELVSVTRRLLDAVKGSRSQRFIMVGGAGSLLVAINGEELVVACMDFEFIGGSLGSVMGEKFSRAVDYCIKHRLPYLVISKSGGARMMESAFSLMQLAKTSGKLAQLSDAKLPYISLLTDPTFGGISASFGMLGDLNIAEPGALIGFAGPRVIRETIKKDLPEGFQRSEFLLEHGFLDFILDRKKLKEELTRLILLFRN